MQLHKVIDKCIEWVAFDGILGTEPLSLHQHLQKSDPSLDDAYFAYLYTVLIENPCIRVSITEEPIAAPDKTIRMGEAPLPDGYELPEAIRKDVDLNALYLNGVKGRQLAFHLAGMEFQSNSQAIEARREVQQQNARTEKSSALRKERDEKKKGPQTNIEDGLIWDLDVDDGAGIAKEDLNGLAHRWGSRLRLRCTDQEVYYRLTGHHTKNSKITPIVYQTLLHAAKSREKGITAIELGPLVGSSQGSMHHYMKVLTTMGLCAKVPTIIHGALTNLLLFHLFLDQNENYKSTKTGMAAAEPQAQPRVTGTVEDEEEDDPSIAPGPATASDWGLTFTDLTEAQLMNGFILRERLLKLLDHPSLTNHLLRAKNLLPLLGWKSSAGLRHRRSIPRAIRALVDMGLVENVHVGESKIRCLRLTKYNPDRASKVKTIETVPEPSSQTQDLGQLVKRYSGPMVLTGGITSLQSIPYQIGDLILQSGSEGMRILDIRDSLFGLFRRMVEFHFARYEKMTSPPVHLQHRRITSVMESFGRERRLRAFSMAAYREFLARNNQPIDDKTHPPTPPQAGHFADISYLPFYTDIKTLEKRTDKLGTPTSGANVSSVAHAQSGVKVKRPRTATPEVAASPVVPVQTTEISAQVAQVAPKPKKPKKADPKRDGYGQESQVRGRPRKYLHVVQQDGTVERNIIGSVLPHPDLAPIWIYLPHLDKLVPAHSSYSGLGEAPEPDEEELKQARAPEWFTKYPRSKAAKPPNMTRRKILKNMATSAKRKESTSDDTPAESDVRPFKRPRPAQPREQEIDELISDDDDIIWIEDGRLNIPAPPIDTPGSGPSGPADEPTAITPQVDAASSNVTAQEADLASAPLEVGEPGPMDSFADDVDPALDPEVFAALSAAEQVSDIDVDTRLDEMATLPKSVSTPKEASIERPVEQVFEALRQASPPAHAYQASTPLQQMSPATREVSSPTRQPTVTPHYESHSPTRAPSPPTRIAPASVSPPLREMSPPAPTHYAPQTPTHHHYPAPPAQPQYYTPPGVQSYTILPPVVYVPPGYTVWPPLPPGYPTTHVPPPDHQAGPAHGPPPPMPGFWTHGPQQPSPYQPQHHLPHQSQQYRRHQPQYHRPHQSQQHPPHHSQQYPPQQPQHRSPYGSHAQSPMNATTSSSRAPNPVHNGHSPTGTSPRSPREHLELLSSRPSPATPPDAPGVGPSSSRNVNGSRSSNQPAHAPPATASHSRNPISRLQSGEVSRPPVSSPTPVRSASPRQLALVRETPTQSIASPVAQPSQSPVPDKSASPVTLAPTTPLMKTSMPPQPTPVPEPLAETTADSFGGPDTGPSESEAHVDPSQDPSSQTLNSALELTPIRAPKKARKGRMDLGVIRRANEMLVVLQEAGGVLEEHALWRRHQAWSFRVAGTDIPFAPNKGATMDRSVWKRLLQSTKDDGRINDTVSMAPTSAAAWRTNRIIWLVDTPQEKVQEYMRGLANTIKKATAPKEIVSTKLPHMQYTEVKLPYRHPSSTVQHQIAEIIDNECRGLTGDERRNALCKDPLILSQLYGRQSGKWARTNTFHLSVRATVQSSNTTAVLDRSAGVFLSPMMSQDIPIGAFYAVVITHERDENLLEWLKSPVNRATPVKDVPFDIRISHDQRRQRTQTRIKEHVNMLLALGLISPLSICSPAEAYVTINTPQMPNAPLKIDTKQAMGDAATYVIHDWAPVYHIAAAVPALLGYLPVRTEEEIKTFWETFKLACHEPFVDRLPAFTPRSLVESRNLADSPEILRLSPAWRQTLRQHHRWTNNVRLLPVQRDAVNNTVNWTEATPNIQSEDEFKAIAWEFALPEEAVKKHYEIRLQKAQEAKAKREQRTRAMDEALSARHVKAQRALAFKLSERQAQSRRTWEERVARICAQLHVHYDHPLLDHVSRQSLTSMTKGFLTDEMIERIIRQYFSHRLLQSIKNNVPPPSMPLQAIPVVRTKGPKTLPKKDRPWRAPGTRYRRKWSAEDDELIVDAEAIIRARNRDRPHNQKTRNGPERMFPGSLLVSCTARLKKTINTPQRVAYLDLLEKAWYDIWIEYRGTDELKDDHPEHNEDFDIREHVDFLRKHVNKTQMRVEAESSVVSGVKKEPAPELPDSLDKVLSGFRWQHLRISRPHFDMLWQANNSQDARLGQVGSLSTLQVEKPAVKPPKPDLARFRLRGILKMIIATDPSQYAQPAAISLLEDYDQAAAVNPEIIRMQQEKILVRHSSASSTGRFYSFASAWDTLRLGPFTDDFYQDAARLDSKLSTPAGVDWPVVGSSGELASLMNMVSNQSVEFEFDTEDFPIVVGGYGLQNTRRLNDISFEFGIKVKKNADPAPVVEPPSIYFCPAPRQWQIDSPDADLTPLYVQVGMAGPNGISKPELQTALGISRDELHRLLAALADGSIQPVTFWAGYDTARLVSTSFWSEWQCPARRFRIRDDGWIMAEGDGEVRCTPRVWVDIWGRRLESKWEEAVGCAKGWLVSRPGMSERIFREKLGVVMDRLEVNDVLQFLLDKETACRVWLDDREGIVPPIEAVDVDEEENIIWRPEPKRLLA